MYNLKEEKLKQILNRAYWEWKFKFKAILLHIDKYIDYTDYI